jgi:hypothetical protein
VVDDPVPKMSCSFVMGVYLVLGVNVLRIWLIMAYM